ncbi:DUF7577 domain-containing protein [Streptomyces virginiae]|uniref:DUF7577 domain-containing protein n=1 Tax=Streptomyces virginiae TaxID=1961 RepID=UPI003249560C
MSALPDWWTCGFCGGENDDAFVYCPECGHRRPHAAVTDTDLHFGADPGDPNGTADCSTCAGEGTVPAPPRPCPACHERQLLRNGWWAGGPGPERLAAKLRAI